MPTALFSFFFFSLPLFLLFLTSLTNRVYQNTVCERNDGIAASLLAFMFSDRLRSVCSLLLCDEVAGWQKV